MSVFQRAADIAHRGVVLGLLSFFGFQAYQIAKFTLQGKVESPYLESTYFQEVNEKVKEEYRKDNIVDRRDWYEADDNSYLKDQIRPNITKPEFMKNTPQGK